jgi:hypothetical protein
VSAANTATVVALLVIMGGAFAHASYRAIEAIRFLRASRDRAEDLVAFLLERNATLWTRLTYEEEHNDG